MAVARASSPSPNQRSGGTSADETDRDRDPAQHRPDDRERDLGLPAQLGDADSAVHPTLELIDDPNRHEIEGKNATPECQPTAGRCPLHAPGNDEERD